MFHNLFRRKKKGIGILTYHCADNAGAQMQAFAMQQYLGQFFRDPIMVDFQNEFRRSRLVPAENMRDVHEHIAFIKRFYKSDLLPDEAQAADWINTHCSTLFVGSDEVWRIILEPNAIAHPSIYYGTNVHIPRIGYAVTMSGSKLRNAEPTQMKRVAQEIEKFAFIACRDLQTMDFVQQYSTYPVDNMILVPDPTFAVDLPLVAKEDLLAKITTLGINPDKPLLLLISAFRYSLDIEFVEGLVKQGYQVISTLNQAGAISLEPLHLNPIEWFSLPRAVNFVYTQRMHGLIASLLANTPVVSLDSRFKSQNLIQDFKLPSGNIEQIIAQWSYDFVEQKKEEYKKNHRDAIKKIQRIIA